MRLAAGALCAWRLCAPAFTQRLADIAEGEDTKEAPDARANLELGVGVFVELRHFIDRHLRFLGQGLDGSLVMGFFAVISVHKECYEWFQAWPAGVFAPLPLALTSA